MSSAAEYGSSFARGNAIHERVEFALGEQPTFHEIEVPVGQEIAKAELIARLQPAHARALRMGRKAWMVCHSSGMPRPVVASVFMIGGRHSPSAERLQRQVRLDRRHHPVGAVAVGLVDDEDVGDLHDPGLERLHIVAGAGHEDDDRDVGRADDVHFVLADADRFDDDEALAGGVEHQRDVARRARQAARAGRAWPSSG